MFEGWDEFYFMTGSSAAALIGLLFVVATLTAGRDRSTMEAGQKIFITPLVWHFGAVLVLSAAALVPSVTPLPYALLSGAIALVGVGFGVWITIRISRAPQGIEAGWFDIWWYGIFTTIIYVLLGVAAAAICSGASWALVGLAVVQMSLLLTTIHNAWDLVTYLAPRADPPAKS
jgi:hypothetical protein